MTENAHGCWADPVTDISLPISQLLTCTFYIFFCGHLLLCLSILYIRYMYTHTFGVILLVAGTKKRPTHLLTVFVICTPTCSNNGVVRLWASRQADSTCTSAILPLSFTATQAFSFGHPLATPWQSAEAFLLLGHCDNAVKNSLL